METVEKPVTVANNQVGPDQVLTFPLSRVATLDVLALSRRVHHVPVLLEVDVTEARLLLSARRSGQCNPSFTAWSIRCVAQAASEHKRVHARRHGRRKLVVFDDVDVSLSVYRRMVGDDTHERLPMPVLLRRANEMTVEDLSARIDAARTMPLKPGQQWLALEARTPPAWLLNLSSRLPFALRRWFYWGPLLRNAYRTRRTMGSVSVTSLSVEGSGWGIPLGLHTLLIALGGIEAKPRLVRGRVETRDMMSLTVLFDHGVVDGLPVARFIRRLKQLMEEGAFL